jgi:hypothetical protein
MRTVMPSVKTVQASPAFSTARSSALAAASFSRLWRARSGAIATTWPWTSSNRPRGWAMAQGMNSSTVMVILGCVFMAEH